MQPLAAISPLVPILILAVSGLLFLRIPVLTEILVLPYTLVRWLVTPIALFKKRQNWSVVYDAKTKLPIDPAYVTVRNTLGVELNTLITDLNGRFSLILPRGIYTINVQKTNYTFPAFSLKGARTDGQYSGLYYGETINVTDDERAVAIAIPMDPIGKDWNQSEKKRHNTFLHFVKQSNAATAEILYLLIGAFLVGVHYVFYSDLLYKQIGLAYMALIFAVVLWRLFEPGHFAHGIVIDRHTKVGLAFARVTVFNTHENKIIQKITSFEGEFSCLVSKGKYYVTIERRDPDGSYVLAYTSPFFHVYNGIIDRRFVV